LGGGNTLFKNGGVLVGKPPQDTGPGKKNRRGGFHGFGGAQTSIKCGGRLWVKKTKARGGLGLGHRRVQGLTKEK